MRPKLLARFDGYVADMDATTVWMITGEDQIESPLDRVPTSARRRLRLGHPCRLLVYENRVSFRLTKVGRWTAQDIKSAKRAASKLYRMLRAAQLADLAA